MAGTSAVSVIAGALTDLLEGLEDDVDVIDALDGVAQSITVLTTNLKQKRQVSSKKRARPPSPSDGQVVTGGRLPESIWAFPSVSTRPAALDRLSHESVVHIFSYLDTSQSTVLTAVACVCRAWKAAAHTDALWAQAAHKLLPFTTQADNEAVQTLLGSVGGYRELIIRYAAAIALDPPKPGSLKKHRALRGGFNLLPFQVIFELRDRIADRALISTVGSGRFGRLDGLEGLNFLAMNQRPVIPASLSRWRTCRCRGTSSAILTTYSGRNTGFYVASSW